MTKALDLRPTIRSRVTWKAVVAKNDRLAESDEELKKRVKEAKEGRHPLGGEKLG